MITIKFLKNQIDFLENEVRNIINSNKHLKEKFDRITEIKNAFLYPLTYPTILSYNILI